MTNNATVGFQKLTRRDTPPPSAGIYIIYRGSKVIYVGRAKNLRKRINCHLLCRLRGFSTHIKETNNGVLLESELIDRYNPILNRSAGGGCLRRYGGLGQLKKMAMNNSMSLTAIGLHFHVQDQTVLNWLNKYNLERRYVNKQEKNIP